jgi:TolB protein
MRIAALAVLLVTLPVAAASSGGPAAAFLFTDRAASGHTDVFVSAQDGSGRASVAGGIADSFDPAWSPDGTRIAFSSSRDANGTGNSDLYVAAPDGSSLTRLTFDAPDGVAKSAPAWSSDARTIAYLAGGASQDVWTVPADGGAPRRLTMTGGQKVGLAWEPSGDRLLTTEQVPGGPIVVSVDPETRSQATLAAGWGPAWSPDGSRIAFVDAAGHATVMNADGSGASELTDLPSADPAWSPDGARVVFKAWFNETSLPMTRYGYPTRTDLYAAPADGSTPPQRLTGPLDPTTVPPTLPYRPAYSPDGTAIVYRVDDNTVWLMNADGSCEHPLPALTGVGEGPYWRPGSAAGSVSCVDLSLHPVVDPGPFALGQWAPLRVTVENGGNLAAHDVVLHVTPMTPESLVDGCNPRDTCSIGTLSPGRSRTIYLNVTSRGAGSPGVQIAVTSVEPDITPNDTTATATTTILPCTIVGTSGADHLEGTASADRICGLTGADWISGGRGDDYLDAGNGNDTVFGGPGHDTILGRGGRDVIFARDGQRDWIDCGTEYDIAVVDKLDHVRNCERVLRR